MAGVVSSAWAHGSRVRLGVNVGIGKPGHRAGELGTQPQNRSGIRRPITTATGNCYCRHCPPPVYIEQSEPAAQWCRRAMTRYYCKRRRGYCPTSRSVQMALAEGIARNQTIDERD